MSNLDIPKILIVEDEAVTARLLRSRLEKFGYQAVGPATTGEAAVEIASREKPDLILMDINLAGDMDGINAAETIQSQIPAQIVYLTAHTEEDLLNRAKLTIPYAYIIRPFKDRELRVALEMALYAAKADAQRRQAEQALRASEEQLRAAIDSGLDSFFILKALRNEMGELIDFVFQDMNTKAEEMLRIPRDRLIGKRMCQELPVNVPHGYFEKYKKVVETGIPFEEEFNLADTHAPDVWYYHQVVKLGDGIVISHRDINDLKKTQGKIQTQRDMLSAIFDSAPYIMMLINEEGRVENINRKGIQHSSLEKEKLIGLLGGEVLGCLNSFDGGGCSRNEKCTECPVRTRVMKTFETEESIFEEEASMALRKKLGKSLSHIF